MKLLFILPAVILFSGCKVIIPVDISKTTGVVVDGVFNPDSLWSVTLSLNKGVLKNSRAEKIPDDEIKSVTIRDENHALIESLQYEPGKDDQDYIKREYKGQTKPEFNKIYRLEAETRSYGTLTSSGYVPPKVPVTSAKIEKIKSNKNIHDRLITVEFSDDGNTADFYEIYLLKYEDHYDRGEAKPKYRTYSVVDLKVNDLVYSEKVKDEKFLIFDDTLFNGKPAKFTLKTECECDQIIIVLRNMTEDLYKVTSNHGLQRESSDNPFAEPLIIKGNIQNGYGVFAGYSASVYTF